MYTKENLDQIKADGLLPLYILHEKKSIADYADASLEEDGDYIRYGSCGGCIGYCFAAKDDKIVAISYQDGWSSSWVISSFTSDKAALAYAHAALKNHLKSLVTQSLRNSVARLKMLLSAQGD